CSGCHANAALLTRRNSARASSPGQRAPPSEAASARVPVSIPPAGAISSSAGPSAPRRRIMSSSRVRTIPAPSASPCAAGRSPWAHTAAPGSLSSTARTSSVPMPRRRSPGTTTSSADAPSPAPASCAYPAIPPSASRTSRGPTPSSSDALSARSARSPRGAQPPAYAAAPAHEQVPHPAVVGRPERPQRLLPEGGHAVRLVGGRGGRLDGLRVPLVHRALDDLHASPPASLGSVGRTALYPTLRTVPIN